MPSQPSGTSVLETTQPPQEENPFDPNGDHAVAPERDPQGTYAELSAPFDLTFTDVRGGVELTYISGEQVASRLNLILGPGKWSFTVVREGYEAGIDWLWCLGHLEAIIDGDRCVREQYGGSQIKRGKPPCAYESEDGVVCDDKAWEHDKRHRDHHFIAQPRGVPLNLGFDKKASATDAFKKCAQGLGIGLYLAARVPTEDGRGQSAAVGRSKQPRPAQSNDRQRSGQQQPSPGGSPNGSAQPARQPAAPARSAAAEGPPTCQSPNCGQLLCDVHDQGVNWTVTELVRYGRAITKELGQEKVVCWKHYLAAREHRNKKLTESSASSG